jgi:gliding motility-associated transport system ATP-binding protein
MRHRVGVRDRLARRKRVKQATADAASRASGVGVEAFALTRRFGKHLAVDGIDLQIAARTRFALLGPNGAGKTTFLRMLTGFLLPTSGELTVGGISAARHPHAVNQCIGFAMEAARLYPEMRVRALLRFLAGARGLRRGKLEHAVDRVIERFQLDSVATRRIGNLSRGFERRVSVAQAFLVEPPLIVLDEPTEGLDPAQRNQLREILRSIEAERTLILCTHDLDEAGALCDRAGVLNAGRLIAEGPMAEILDRRESLSLFEARLESKAAIS